MLSLPFMAARKPTPWISSVCEYPLVTPSARLTIWVRAIPHMARACFVSWARLTSMPSAPLATLIGSGQVNDSSPLGPFMVTFWPATVAVTPEGTATGFLPIRDILSPSSLRPIQACSEHAAQDLAADVLLARACV